MAESRHPGHPRALAAGWLRTVALNLVRDRKRAQKSRPSEVEDAVALLTAPDTADAVDRALDGQVMAEATDIEQTHTMAMVATPPPPSHAQPATDGGRGPSRLQNPHPRPPTTAPPPQQPNQARLRTRLRRVGHRGDRFYAGRRPGDA